MSNACRNTKVKSISVFHYLHLEKLLKAFKLTESEVQSLVEKIKLDDPEGLSLRLQNFMVVLKSFHHNWRPHAVGGLVGPGYSFAVEITNCWDRQCFFELIKDGMLNDTLLSYNDAPPEEFGELLARIAADTEC